MKGFYGSGTHDSKVEDYNKYKERKFNAYKDTVNIHVDSIKSSSLTEDDKLLLLEELKKTIDNRITKQIK